MKLIWALIPLFLFGFVGIQQALGDEVFLTPKTQVQQGIQPEAVMCKETFVLIIKQSYSPACVKPETAEKLVERGWGNWPVPCCKPTTISNFKSFEECVAAGNPILEEYDPRRCRASDGKHYVESISGP